MPMVTISRLIIGEPPRRIGRNTTNSRIAPIGVGRSLVAAIASRTLSVSVVPARLIASRPTLTAVYVCALKGSGGRLNFFWKASTHALELGSGLDTSQWA